MKTKSLIFTVLLSSLVLFNVGSAILHPGQGSTRASAPTQGRYALTLVAKEWNNGKVHIWNNLSEDATTTFTDVAGQDVCQRLDNELHKSRYAPYIYYYKVDCGNGVVGYVEQDQAR